MYKGYFFSSNLLFNISTAFSVVESDVGVTVKEPAFDVIVNEPEDVEKSPAFESMVQSWDPTLSMKVISLDPLISPGCSAPLEAAGH